MSHKIANLNNAQYIQAAESYSVLVLETGKKQLKTRPMKFFMNILENNGWCRIHKSFMVNPLYVQNITHDRSGICLQDGKILPISRRNQRKVIKWRNAENSYSNN